MDFMVRSRVTFATGFMQSWGGGGVFENDFCFVCLIGKIHSVAREMVILLCFEERECRLRFCVKKVIYVLSEKSEMRPYAL